ncbi:MAG: aminotransferase class V-fold PLP-dependent enzyme [Pirellulaceae bacterium]
MTSRDTKPLPLDVESIRHDFPILSRELRPGVPLVYLDNAASTQRPRAVIDAMDDCYKAYYANVHRGIHTLSEEATEAFDRSKADRRRFPACVQRTRNRLHGRDNSRHQSGGQELGRRTGSVG